jgi:hypothetical protein
VRKTGGPLRGCRVELEERVLADLHVHQPRLFVLVEDTKGFAVSHLLRVVRDSLRDIRNVDPDVIHHDNTTVVSLGQTDMNGRTHNNSGSE